MLRDYSWGWPGTRSLVQERVHAAGDRARVGWRAVRLDVRGRLIPAVILGVASACLVASSNYTINEWLDAPEDRQHPNKKRRPTAAAGRSAARWRTRSGLCWRSRASWSRAWVRGRSSGAPRRCSDAACLQRRAAALQRPAVHRRAVRVGEQPAAALAGLVRVRLRPDSSGLAAPRVLDARRRSFMAMKRFGELRHLNDYGRSDRVSQVVSPLHADKLLISVVFYATAFGLFGGIFMIRYRVEFILAMPFVAGLIAMYMHLGLLPNSPAQIPEALFRHRPFLVYGCLTRSSLIVARSFECRGSIACSNRQFRQAF